MFDAKSLLDSLLGGAGAAGRGGQGAGGLGGALGGMLEQVQRSSKEGGLTGAIGNVLGQATGGLRDAAGDINQRTGIGDKAGEAFNQATGGRSPQDVAAQAKDFLGSNPMAAGAVLAGLGSLLLGTGAGRSLTANAAKLGGLAMIGGLAYKAYQNYQQGKSTTETAQPQIEAAPGGSGFEPAAATHNSASLLIQAMVAAAAADGHIDETEKAALIGNLKHVGLDADAVKFLDEAIAKPLTVDQLVAAVDGSAELGSQVYAAARLAIDPDMRAEKHFLAKLASGLKLDPQLVAHIDAAATGTAKG